MYLRLRCVKKNKSFLKKKREKIRCTPFSELPANISTMVSYIFLNNSIRKNYKIKQDFFQDTKKRSFFQVPCWAGSIVGGRVSKLIRFTNGRNDLKGKHFRDYFHITTLREHLALLKLLSRLHRFHQSATRLFCHFRMSFFSFSFGPFKLFQSKYVCKAIK